MEKVNFANFLLDLVMNFRQYNHPWRVVSFFSANQYQLGWPRLCVGDKLVTFRTEFQRRIFRLWSVDTMHLFCGVTRVGVVISQLNKMKFAKMSGSLPENVTLVSKLLR
jgi:hypothetical protein